MRIIIDKSSKIPIYMQVKKQIQEMIIGNILPEGFLLPPERKLSQVLEVNRSTILRAYQELKADGLIGSHMGSGTYVLPQNENNVTDIKKAIYPMPWYQYFNKTINDANEDIISDVMEVTSHRDIISFAGGMPSPKLYPLEDAKAIMAMMSENIDTQIMQHSPVEGFMPLREGIAEFVKNRGISTTPREIMILSGSQQGLDYAAKVFISPGDIVVTEDPTYLGAIQLFKAAGARVMGVPIDKDGIRTDMLEALLSRYKPKMIYTLPTFQNPSGTVMSLERRYKLLDLAYRYQIPVLEDDPYGDIRFEGAYVPSLKALDKHGYVIYLSTFSKVLFMGLRVGWITAPAPVIERFALNKQLSDLHVNTFAQCFFANYLKADMYQKHISKITKAYKNKRDIMIAAMEKHNSCDISWEKPEGGYYIWCRIPENISQAKLISTAASKGVAFVPGEAFYTFEGYRNNYIRLNYTYPEENQIEEGITRLMKAIETEYQESLQYGRKSDYLKRPIV